MLALVENTRRKQLAWVNAILLHKGWRPTRLANEAGVNHSTLSKWLSDPLNAAQLNSTTVEKIARAGGIPPYFTEPITQPKGLAHREAEIYRPGDDIAGKWVRTLTSERNDLEAWAMKSEALMEAGYLPGDILIVDVAASAEDGDAVCAKLHDRAGRPEMAFRIFEFPYLVAASKSPALRRPILIDNDHATIHGVVVASFRPRLARH